MRPLLSQSAFDLPPWLLLVAAALAVVLLVRTLTPHWPRRRSDPLSRPPEQQPASLAQQRSVERDMQSLMRELSEMSRKIVTQLDARSERLQDLLRQADERIARMESLASRPREESIQQPAAQELNIEIDPRHEQVYLLEREGLGAMQIANRLNMPEGEVELILALRPRRQEAV